MNHLTSETFDANARAALSDDQLRGALRNATSLFGQRRLAAAQSVSNWEDLRSHARRIKDETLLHLDKYLEEFTANAAKAGAQIHWARDGAEANEIVKRLARERGARLVVKSKSMTTEEIHLNDALDAVGVEALETDLGEYIIQLAGETPSHIIAPAIHKTRYQIADLFVEKLGIAPTDDISTLTITARQVLREKFAAADIGISGVNFGVAETGTILILENEGNIRLTTSVPKTHIAVMGIEKVIPRFADLEVFLKLLPRSGTGQHLTSYQSLITGTKRTSEGEGPDELHIIVMDNGRSKMLAHPTTRQSLACIRCGACLNACPVYQQIGGHAYGSVYPGPIGAVITPQLIGLKKAAQLPYASSLCGACREVCPVKIDIPELLLHLRAEITEKSEVSDQRSEPIKRKAGERMSFRLWAAVMTRPLLYEFGGRMAGVLQRLIVRGNRISKVGGLIATLAPPLAAWTSSRDLRPIEPKSFRQQWRERGTSPTPKGGLGVMSAIPNPSNSEARAVILQSIRAHLSESASIDSDHVPTPAVVSDQTEATAPVAVSPVSTFRERLESVGGNCVVVRDEDEAARALADIVSGLQARTVAKRIALSDAPSLSRLTSGLTANHVTVCPTAADLFNYDVGISTAQAGIAETGTLILEAEKERHRLVSLLPPVHIAFIRSDDMYLTIGDAIAALRGGDENSLSRAITFITGPSRTADIELTLTVGVHGPKELYVIVIDSPADDTP